MTSLPILSWHGFLVFTAGELLFSLSPGPTVVMISAYGFRGGFRAAAAAICGTQAGNTVWYLLCVAGLGALVEAWPEAFRALRFLGAAYLVWLGAAALWHSHQAHAAVTGPKLQRSPFVQALLTQLGNPKAMLFFGAFLPQFLDTGAALLPQYAVLFLVTLLGEGLVLSGYGWLAARGGRMAATHHAALRERIGGTVMIGLGLLFAVTA
ncbi:MAG TPA: LysE family translocator [Rhizomicrobium sp.]|nr:LysE family translocator [Rhizomicrobium sp.]